MPTTIVDYNKELINYLEDVNYGMSQPQFNHLATMVEGSINIDGNISISKIAETIAKAKDESCIYKFLSQSPWDDKLLNRNRISFLEHHLEYNTHLGQVGFLVIDDTVNIKNIETKAMQGLDYHYSHSEGKTCWSHCVVTSNFVVGPYSVPLHFKPYYREEKCRELGVEFESKVEIAKDFVKSFIPPTKLKQLYILTDSWYTGTALIEEALSRGYHLIGGVKPNRTISPCGIKLKISTFIKHLDSNDLDVVTVKGKECRVYRYEGKVASFDNAVLLISYEATKDGLNNPVCILCTDIDLSTETILRYYSVRWAIETSYQYLKENLGFDQYRVRNFISIERYMLLCFLAYNFLEIFRVTHICLGLDTIGDSIRYHKKKADMELVEFVYTQAISNVPLERVYMQLKLVA